MNGTDSGYEPVMKIGLEPRDHFRVDPPGDKMYKIAHITDTHLGQHKRTVYKSLGGTGSQPVDVQVRSFTRFKKIIELLQFLNPDIVVHSGDIAERGLIDQQNQLRKMYSNIDNSLPEVQFLYIRGNHDCNRSTRLIRELFPEWDFHPINDSEKVNLIDKQMIIVGSDYQEVGNTGDFDFDPPEINTDVITIGAFHQSFRNVSRSYDADVALTSTAPDGQSVNDYYDILLLGHMHSDYFDFDGGCRIVEGRWFVDLFTFTTAGSHFQRFPIYQGE
ncbi:metallophosphoesterase family protein [Halorubrum ezzemoulense]|uniref:metallophosphoesterase family protein n=1 Tax=Halorubrum ezzemoulense TaxID=337243 RepID=UPI0023305A17|nr:metallophosphoesterase [Halorubrum ezzemoulense]MDB9235448.1 metallophosphoesterase [Halorubrum ezzemoulense]